MLSRFLSLFTRRVVDIPPPAVLAILYAMLIVVGAGLLRLPLATTHPVSWSDALFSATSAVTVTGLSVVEIGSRFTLFGQIVIMLLIQLGGLGLMTFAVLVLSMLGVPIGPTHKVFLRDDLNQTSLHNLLHLVVVILRVVLLCEFIGMVLLAPVFVPEFGLWRGTWYSLFHTVSAFNNAGFTLFDDSLARWATHPLVNAVIPALFIVGGIGFSVLSDLYRERSWQRLSLHSKLMLAGTGGLILFSVGSFALLEWGNPRTLGAFPHSSDRLMVSWFQAVTTRTAGFSTIDVAGIHDSTALMFIALMLIGGGSTSTAGGIKVTTFLVLLMATVAFFKRRSTLNAFHRSIGMEEVMKVLALAVLSVGLIIFSAFIIMISHDGDFLDLLFEVVSAFGTVGLSRGTTEELDGVGRLVIALLMFVGRIGPLTLGFFLVARIPPRIRYPSSRIFLG